MILEYCQNTQINDLSNSNLDYKIKYNKKFKKSNNAKNLEEEDEKKSKQISGFQFISFSYPRINEIHKRKFLHQNNAIEIFLKTGINYYLVFNKDIRDTVVTRILQNISNSIDYINDSFISNSSNNSINLNNILNYNTQSLFVMKIIFSFFIDCVL